MSIPAAFLQTVTCYAGHGIMLNSFAIQSWLKPIACMHHIRTCKLCSTFTCTPHDQIKAKATAVVYTL